MKKIFILLFLLLTISFGNNVFAEGGDGSQLDLENTTDLILDDLNTNYIGGVPASILKNSQTNNSGHWYYQVSGKFTRSLDAGVYLVLQKTKSGVEDAYFDLCYFAPGGGNTRAFNYPDCPGGPTNGISTSLFTSEYDYVAYLSDQSKGLNIDTSGELIYFDDIPVSSGNDLVTISNVEIIDGSTFKVTGNIPNTIDGNVTLKAIGSNTSTSVNDLEEILGSVSGNAGNFTFTKIMSDLSFDVFTIQALYNDQVVGSHVYNSIASNTNSTNTTSNGSTIDLFADSQVVQEIKGGKGLVKQDCGYKLGKDEGGRICGFGDFVSLIQRMIEYIFVLILPIAAIVFAYAGYLYITSGGSSEKRKAAKNAMTKLVIGIIVVMLAWLIVKLVLKTLGVTDGFTMFLDIG